MLYKVVNGVKYAARLAEGGLSKAGGGPFGLESAIEH